MKVALIAHPISGNIKGNLKLIEKIARKINLEEPDVVPFANYFLDCHCLDINDDNPKERERGIKNNTALLQKGFIDEIRLYGNRISNGMAAEITLAKELGISVVPMTEETKNEYYERSGETDSVKYRGIKVDYIPKEKKHANAKNGNAKNPYKPIKGTYVWAIFIHLVLLYVIQHKDGYDKEYFLASKPFKDGFEAIYLKDGLKYIYADESEIEICKT